MDERMIAAGGLVRPWFRLVSSLVCYFGPQGWTPGLDQVNVLLPAQLPGAGTRTWR